MKRNKYVVLFTLFAMNLVEQPAPEVRILQGRLTGKVSGDGTYYEYLGIPYATATGENRFRAPLPPPTWDGVYRAVDEMHVCPQRLGALIMGSEDCLKMNIYTPAKKNKLLPVMVYIHGGAFKYGSGRKLFYGPGFLMRRNVILVTFNYRLGPLGFLCLGTKEAPGNAGLKDQVAALKWVKYNIASFGGDRDRVTIFGESAGGTAVSLLLASDATDGLFKRAIIQSGSSLAHWAINRNPIASASLLAKTFGHETEDPHEIYEILSKVKYKDLVSAEVTKPKDLFYEIEIINLPCVEKQFPGEEAVLTDLPYNLLRQKPKNIPTILGTTSLEGLLLLATESKEAIADRNGRYLFASDLTFSTEEKAQEAAKEMQEFYFGNNPVSAHPRKNITDFFTHSYFEMPVILESELSVNNDNRNVYNFYFNYTGNRNFLKYNLGYTNESGACHGDEVLYLFDGTIWPYRINHDDHQMIEWMTIMWTNFAKYGDPTPASSRELPVRWEPSDKNNLKFLYIDNPMRMGPIPNPDAFQLWKEFYTKYRKKVL